MDKKVDYSTYMQSTIEISDILNDITNFIIDNSNVIIEANKKDIEIYKKQIKIKELLKIVENYRNNYDFQFNSLNNAKRVVVYYGEPYLTLNICIQAIISRTSVYMCFSEFMSNVNFAIIDTLRKVTQKHKLNNLINICDTNYSINEKFDIKQFIDKENINDITVIGDSTVYQLLKPMYNVVFHPYNNIILYSNDEKFEKLKEAIYTYANENNYEVEVVYEDNIEEFVNIINQNKMSNIAVLLTENEDDKQKVKSLLIGKELFINENPFKNDFQTICNYLN